ncbi:hypothetical protein ACLMJK_002296 [Lecanora helva]
MPDDNASPKNLTVGASAMFEGGSSGSKEQSHDASSSAVGGTPGTDSILCKLNPDELVPLSYDTDMSDFHCVASYNWLDSEVPTILVPGSPPVWSKPAFARKLKPDQGEVFIDQNAARYPTYPLEPMFRAIYELHPQFDFSDIDVFIDRNSMNKLLGFLQKSSRIFEIDVEIIGNKAVFVRKEKSATEIITEFRGFGRTFPEEYTSWDSQVQGSSSHHRIARFNFGGLKYLLRFESDGYLAEKSSAKNPAASVETEGATELNDPNVLLGSADTLSLGNRHAITGQALVIRRQGTEIDQEAMFDIKTRAAHRPLDMEAVLPRLWISKIPNLVVGYHRGGRFEDIQVLDVRDDIERWAGHNEVVLKKLGSAMIEIIGIAKSTASRKCRINRIDRGILEIRELGDNQGNALPPELMMKLEHDGDDGPDSELSSSSDYYEDWYDEEGSFPTLRGL